MPSRSPGGFAKHRALKIRDAAAQLRASMTKFGEVYVGEQRELDSVRVTDEALATAARTLDELADYLEGLP